MQVQGIRNTNPNVNFESKRRNNAEEIEAFVNMDDSQLKYCAYLNNQNKKEDRKKANAVNRLFYAIPIIDTLASGALIQKATNPVVLTEEGLIGPPLSKKILIDQPLSTRAMSASYAGAKWAGALGIIGAYGLAKKALVSNSKHLQHFEQTNPVASFMIDVGILITGLAAGQNALEKKFVKSLNNNPEKTLPKLEKIGKFFAKLDDTKFAKKTMPKIQKSLTNFVDNSPKLAKAGRFALANSVWILFGAGLLKTVHNSVQKSKRIEKDYQKLKETQLVAAKYIADEMAYENEILKQAPKAPAKAPKTESAKAQPAEKIEQPQAVKSAEE